MDFNPDAYHNFLHQNDIQGYLQHLQIESFQFTRVPLRSILTQLLKFDLSKIESNNILQQILSHLFQRYPQDFQQSIDQDLITATLKYCTPVPFTQEVTIFLLKTSKSLNPSEVFQSAARFGRLCTLIYLKNSTNIDLFQRDANKNTALHKLSSSGYVHSAVCLIHWLQSSTSSIPEKKARVNQVNKEGFTPLHFAGLSNSSKMCKYLIYLGADPWKKALNGENPYQLAMSQGANPEILKILKPKMLTSFKTRGTGRFFLNFLFLFTRYLLFLLFLLPKVNFFLSAVSLLLSASVIFLLVWVSNVDPGYAKRRKEALERLVSVYSDQACTKCSTVQFEENIIKHCWNCQRCVERYDHHCEWIRNCVGKNNSKAFVVYLACFLAEIGFHCFLVYFWYFSISFDRIVARDHRIFERFVMALVFGSMVLVAFWVLRVFIWQVRRIFIGKTSFQIKYLHDVHVKRQRSVYEDFRQVSALTLKSRYWFDSGTIKENYI